MKAKIKTIAVVECLENPNMNVLCKESEVESIKEKIKNSNKVTLNTDRVAWIDINCLFKVFEKISDNLGEDKSTFCEAILFTGNNSTTYDFYRNQYYDMNLKEKHERKEVSKESEETSESKKENSEVQDK